MSVALLRKFTRHSRTFVLFFGAFAACTLEAHANPLRIDLDRDGIRDILWIAQGPARPGLQLWLSSTQQFTRLRSRGAIHSLIATDVDLDGQPELIASTGRRSRPRLRVWRNLGGGFVESLHRPRHARKAKVSRHTHGRVADLPDTPPSTIASRIFEHVGMASELSYFPVHLTLVVGTIPVSPAASTSPHAPPRSPRAPPTPQHV